MPILSEKKRIPRIESPIECLTKAEAPALNLACGTTIIAIPFLSLELLVDILWEEA